MSFKTIEELDLSENYSIADTEESEVASVKNLFKKLEKDADPADTSIVDSSYADSFLFCDPDNANAVKKEDFLRYLPSMAEMYKKTGFQKKRIKSLEAVKLDENYMLIRLVWKMEFGKDENVKTIDNIKATYILKKETDGNFQIVVQLDHQKLTDII